MKKTLAELILFNNKGQILLQHRTDDAPTFPGKYCIFGGSIEAGEDPLTAVKRECFEELEYQLDNPKLILNITCTSVLGDRIKYIFAEKYNPSQKLVLHEGQDMKWVGADKYNKLPIIDHDLIVLDKVFNERLLQ